MKRFRELLDRLLPEVGRQSVYDPRLEARTAARELHDAMSAQSDN